MTKLLSSLSIFAVLVGCGSVPVTSTNKSSVDNLDVTSGINSLIAKFDCVGGKKYKIKHRIDGDSSWNESSWEECPSNDYMMYQISGLDCGTTYEVKVRRRWRTTWYNDTETTHACTTPVTPSAGAVRIKHIPSGKCVYGYRNGPDWLAHNFGCWADPQMSFEVLNVSNGIKLKHEASGRCLSVQGVNGHQAKVEDCYGPYDSNKIFLKEIVGPDSFRLKNAATGQCLYGTDQDGGGVHHWQCWEDPNMVFTFE